MDPRAGRGVHVHARKFFASVRERLLAFAAHEFRLARRVKGTKETERQHLEAAAQRGDARAKAELRGPACPPAAEYLWGWFKALDGARGGTGFGPAPIGWGDLVSFAALQGTQLSAFEIDCLRALDMSRLSAQAEEAE